MMIQKRMARKWTPLGLWQRVRQMIKQPGDLILFWRLGWFIWRAPGWLDQSGLPTLLKKFRSADRPKSIDPNAAIDRIERLSKPWLRRSFFRARNTCYLRSLMMFRYLEATGHDVRINFVVEPGLNPGDRLKGHAWVTLDGEIIQSTAPEVVERTRRLYVYPPTR